MLLITDCSSQVVRASDLQPEEEIVQDLLWDGVGAYIAVERQFIQEKLDDFHSSGSTACNGPKLFLPEKPVFPDTLEDNQHVAYLAVGYWQFNDFQSYSDSRYSYRIMTASVEIPLLTDNPTGIPHYSLSVALFYDKDITDFPKPNMAYPYIPVEEITMINNSFVMRNGTDEMVLLLKNTDPCKPELPVARHEFDKFSEQEFQVALSEPDFSFCDRHPVDNHFCRTAKKNQMRSQSLLPKFMLDILACAG
ncbi:hypothetical protein HOLleu_27601 [Holothuria leucospilota]|uniref:Uncharacterized protein n=1 Tax=Holothuria leucospilota TaxID=206669 RepID=A0A9Q1BQY9_HOLLE|nr:hypothetical protein HOLleu_27601 [Holothuria leucospilota]